MGILVHVHTPPRKQVWKVIVDGRNAGGESELLDWLRGNASGDVCWTKAQFADKASKKYCVPNRKRNFTDGYWQYTIWFAKKADAALCRMFWDLCRDDS